jgi:hypothetical protein
MSQLQTWFAAVASSTGFLAAGWWLAAPLADLVVLTQHPVHGGHRPQVHALVQELGVDRGRRLVDVLGAIEPTSPVPRFRLAAAHRLGQRVERAAVALLALRRKQMTCICRSRRCRWRQPQRWDAAASGHASAAGWGQKF